MSNTAQTLPAPGTPIVSPKTWVMAGLIALIVIATFSRLFNAGFSGLDDDIHVYANPYLNPPTLASVKMLWTAPYCGLYVPLAYTFFAIVAHFSQLPETFLPSMGELVTVGPARFHAVNIFVHAANAVMVFTFLRTLTKREILAFVCALLFAMHPIQVESVGWVSELRGLSGSFFALAALNLFVMAREAKSKSSIASSACLVFATLSIVCGMLCKPSVVALPLVTLAVDTIVYKTDWRKASVLAAFWLVCSVPFLLITRSIQVIDPLAKSLVWQRPFVAGDALAFYIGKIILPINLCIDYGRTPMHLFTHWWCYLTWIVPVTLLALAYKYRQSRPLTFLGALMFVAFLLPVLGLVPFSYQEFSTVSDRYAYLSLLGVVLVVLETIDKIETRAWGPVAGVVCAVYAGLSLYQSQFWLSESAFLEHTIAVNKSAAFAYNNLGQLQFGNKQYQLALNSFLNGIRVSPGHAQTDINAADCYMALNEPVQAKDMLKQALKEPAMSADNWSDMGNVLLKMNDTANGLEALRRGVVMSPGKPSCVFNYAKGLASAGRNADAQTMFEKAISLAPSLSGPRIGLGVVLAETGHLQDAQAQFATALALDPSNPQAQQNYRQAQQLLAQQHGGG